MASAMNGEQLIGYCEIHCKTERALFSRQQVNAMIELAGFPEDYVSQIPPMISWVSLHEEMEELCRLARKRIDDEKLELEAHGRFHRPTPPDQKQAVIIPFKMNVAAAQSDIIDALQNKGKQMNFHPFEDSEENRVAAEEKAAQDRNDDVARHNAMLEENNKLKAEIEKLQLKIAELEKDVGRLASNNVSLRQEFCQPKLF